MARPALLAALLFVLLDASLARAATPQALTALTPSFVTAGAGTARVVVSPDGKSVYATNKSGASLSQYARNAVTGVLTALSPTTVETGEMPEGVTVSPDGTSVYVANHMSNTVSQYSRDTTTGKLTPLSPTTVAAGVSPTGIAISADGKSVYAANSTSQTVSEYSRDTKTGKLTPLSTATVPSGANAHGVVVSPDGKNVYETNYGAGTVSQYSRNTETGALTALSTATVPAGTNPHDLAISTDEKNVYVADSGVPGAIAQFTRNAATGALTALSKTSVAAGEFTEGVVVSPDGNGVYATNEGSSNVSEYFRNTETGALMAQTPATVSAGASPEGLAISADGKNVYTADNGASGISQYARNPEPPQSPTVLTGAASAVTQTSATLPGSVNPNGQEVTECRIEYGTTSGYGSIASCASLPGSGSSPVAVSASITGLTASTTYHFRVVAANASGIGNGPDETFKTLSSGPTVVTKAASAMAQTTATLNATVNPNGNEVSECKLEYGTTEAYGSSVTCTAAPGSGTSPVAVSGSMVGLAANTTYHFRISATNAGGTNRGADETLKTLPNAPTVITKAASALTQTTATLNATVNPNGGEVGECKLEYGTTNAYGSSATCTPTAGSGTSAVAVSAAIASLTANTTYHFRIVATNTGGTSKGADETLKMLPNAPTVETKAASALGQTTATLNATVNPNGGAVSDCKLEYGTTSAYGSSATCSPAPGSGTSPVAVSASITGLTANTTYHFRIVATNGGTSEGADETLRTLPNAPAVVTKAPSAVTQTSATLAGTVNPNGGEVSECRFEYGTTNAYGSSVSCSLLPGSGTSPVAVSASLGLLTLIENTTYHFRVVVTNPGGTSKGADETFKTLPNPPTVATNAPSAVTQTAATLNATVNPNGGEVSECRLEYGTTAAYGSSATCTSLPGSGTSPVAVSGSVGGLSPNTTYHVRISATNPGGSGKGADETVKTLPNAPTVETKAASSVTQTTAALTATVNPNGGEVSECELEYGTTTAYGSSAPCTAAPGSGMSPVGVAAPVTGLTANTTYHLRISATNAGGTSKGADETLKTIPNAPAVVTKAASVVTQTSATLTATVNPNGGEVSQCRFEYGTTTAYGSSASCSSLPGSGATPVGVSAAVTGVTANTTYHFRISATNAGGTSKGTDETLKTLPNAPTVVTKTASALAQTTATLNATVNPNGGEVSECELEYGTTNAYGSSAPCATSPGSGTGTVAVSASASGLSANTTYHLRISATNAGGTSRGADETLKTLPNAPAVLTKAPAAITQTSATLNATVNPNGGEVGECRFEYGTTEAYGSSVPCSSPPGSGTSPVAVSASLGLLTLTENTTYHFRISATNAGGTGKGDDGTLKTLPNPPAVEAKAASFLTQTTATLNGTVNPNGGEVGECRFEYGTTTTYGQSASCTPSPGSGSGPVAVSASVGGLSANTTYHFRVVATNAGGTSKGSDEVLTTLPNPPTVETNAASALTQTTATLNATVNPNGGAVSECKLEYGPTNAYGSSVSCASLPGPVTSPVSVSGAVTGLSANTIYHFRVSATNAGGTSNGSDEKLTTLPNPPTVVTGAASSPTQTKATLNATVNPNGGEVSECKLEYGTTAAYGQSAACATSPGAGTGAVAVSASITGLSANTAYHFRIVAKNAGGTSNGNDEKLETLPNAPTVETKAASALAQTTATLNATVNPNSGTASECRFEYGTTRSYGSSAPCSSLPGSGSIAVPVSASASGLNPNTTYHFRISATNPGGTSNGGDEVVKTLPNAPTVLTGTASSLTQTAATLNASVNPNGGEVGECKLEYGTTTAYGSSAPCTPSPGSGASPAAISASISGLTVNTTYHFRVMATNAGGTSKGADETTRTLPNPPTVETKAASSVAQITASLNATVNPDGGEVTECRFEYGTTTGYGSSAPCTSPPGSGTSAVAVSASIAGLSANTIYHFRIVAKNAGGTSPGSDETLKTLPSPTVETKAASSVTQTTATFNAAVNPNAGEVGECHFEYGSTETYGTSVPCSPAPGSGTSAVAVSAAVGGLNPNTTYHFRVVATNAGGTSKGTDETFTMLPNPPTVVTEAASAIAQTSATLNATVNPNGGEVGECKLEYGTTGAYGASVPCSSPPGTGTNPIAVSASVGGLSPNTTYHFRISATDAGGTSRGADQALLTPPTPPLGAGSQGVLPSQESKAPPVPDAKLTRTSLTVSPSGSVSAKVTCPTGESSCTGTVVLQTLTAVSAATTGHQSKHKLAVLMLASRSFTVAGGQVKVVTLHLSAEARALLAHAHVLRVRATITARDPAGAKHTVQTIVTLRPPKATRHH